jgi:hypothetical protein
MSTDNTKVIAVFDEDFSSYFNEYQMDERMNDTAVSASGGGGGGGGGR